jgi:anaphase-promoting complex subunit 6
MSYLQLSLSDLAEEYLTTAASYNSTDPLLLNELGVAAYNRDDYLTAIEYFEAALAGAVKMQGSSEPWAATHTNMGHALRNLGRYDEAKKHYASAIRLNPTDATAYASQGMISQFLGDVRGAIKLYHQALAILPQEPVATILLEMALTEQVRTLDPTTLPGLPAAIVDKDLDPFNVPKGNPAFGPLPIEADPLTLEEAGDASRVSAPGGSARTVVPHHYQAGDMTSMSMSMSMSMASRHLPPGASIMDESSVMDIEED